LQFWHNAENLITPSLKGLPHMTALDACEPQIIRALEKAGWQIVDKPYSILVERNRSVHADFSAQRTTDKGTEMILIIEVKCFTNPRADLQELYTAIGQYQYYRSRLHRSQDNYPLFLAIPAEAYGRFSAKPSFLDALMDSEVQLLIVDTVAEVILQWYI
jgi:hypothetical protein